MQTQTINNPYLRELLQINKNFKKGIFSPLRKGGETRDLIHRVTAVIVIPFYSLYLAFRALVYEVCQKIKNVKVEKNSSLSFTPKSQSLIEKLKSETVVFQNFLEQNDVKLVKHLVQVKIGETSSQLFEFNYNFNGTSQPDKKIAFEKFSKKLLIEVDQWLSKEFQLTGNSDIRIQNHIFCFTDEINHFSYNLSKEKEAQEKETLQKEASLDYLKWFFNEAFSINIDVQELFQFFEKKYAN